MHMYMYTYIYIYIEVLQVHDLEVGLPVAHVRSEALERNPLGHDHVRVQPVLVVGGELAAAGVDRGRAHRLERPHLRLAVARHHVYGKAGDAHRAEVEHAAEHGVLGVRRSARIYIIF